MIFNRFGLITNRLQSLRFAVSHFSPNRKLAKLKFGESFFLIRTGSSDIYTVTQCLNLGDQNISRWEIPIFLKVEDIRADYILDLGSNIGASVLFYRLKFPSAQIYAFEPFGENFELLEKNISNNNVSVNRYGIGANSSYAKFMILEDSKYWEAAKADSAEEGESVQVVTLSEIIGMFKIPKVDILKLSIEGDEGEVLLSVEDWSLYDIVCVSIRTSKNPTSLGLVTKALGRRGEDFKISLVGSVVWSYPAKYLRKI